MLNFRKLRQDLSSSLLREGRGIYDKGMVLSVKMVGLKSDTVSFQCRIQGSFDNSYNLALEIDRQESSIIDSDCDCPHQYDCQHLSGVLYHLESHYDEILLAYSNESDVDLTEKHDEISGKTLLEVVQEAASKETARHDKECQKQMLAEYVVASQVLAQTSFFQPEEDCIKDRAEIAIIFTPPPLNKAEQIEFQIALRLPSRSKALNIIQLKPFLDAVRYQEPLFIGSKRFCFSMESFDEISAKLLQMIIDFARVFDPKNEKQQRLGYLESEAFGMLLGQSHTLSDKRTINFDDENECCLMPKLYVGAMETPLKLAVRPAELRFSLQYLEAPTAKLLLQPGICLGLQKTIGCDEAILFQCTCPGLIYQNTYYRFSPSIRRKHLRKLGTIRDMTVPEPLFGTFIENALPELKRLAIVDHCEILDRFVTLPFTGQLKAECHISYLDGEMEASLNFIYGDVVMPAASTQLTIEQIKQFVTPHGILARNLTDEQKIIDQLFQDFLFDPSSGVFSTKNEKKIIEFMTEAIPAHQSTIKFHCPENLLDQFIYDNTSFGLSLTESDKISSYKVTLSVDGPLADVSLDLLWDCLSSRRSFIELQAPKKQGKRKTKGDEGKAPQRILVLDLERLAPIVQLFDEMGISCLKNYTEERPLWSLASIDPTHYEGLPIKFTLSSKLKEIQEQMLGLTPYPEREIPQAIQASLRNYQIDGIRWLDRLRSMHLNGILADDMGLGKTLQAIIVLTQYLTDNPGSHSIVVCPTSLIYNWKEEIGKFNPRLRVLVVDGNPQQRKKQQNEIKHYDVIVISYTLMQKDIEFFRTVHFGYAILDEAQHIKNRGTRNAQSVKMIQAVHRLILTGTPIENSLDELWSLFDFLMPGLLSSYDRFVEKYIRTPPSPQGVHPLDHLKRKVSPFVLRRMKQDVLQDLPPVSEIYYHCHLSDLQQELYHSYAASAREELSQLVKKEGFDRVQIHILATLTRLKQICCHPAIFAKDKAETGDSAKYDMLLELLQTLIDGKHKTVIFSQYTRMLSIMRNDLQRLQIPFEYLDGTSKNRLDIVKEFNNNPNIPIFLVSLKAGGAGLNLVGADTVIHYDMWWNPAVESQATDRVHRMGQKQSVSSYKLITLNTIEEKILDLHQRKKGLVKNVISQDDEMMAKLTWEEVLELLQT